MTNYLKDFKITVTLTDKQQFQDMRKNKYILLFS